MLKARNLPIIVDTREQCPFTFAADTITPRDPFVSHTVTRGTLPEGDYTIESDIFATLSERIIVERKSLADLYQSCTQARERVEAEFGRLAAYGYAAVVIEADWSQIMEPNKFLNHHTLANPKTIAATLIAWSQRFGVHIFPCPGRVFAEKITFRMLERWAKDHM